MRLLTENNEDEELSSLGDAKGDYISLRNHRLVRIDRSGSLEGLACDSVHGTGRDIFRKILEYLNPLVRIRRAIPIGMTIRRIIYQ
jgi:hypothetical protein